MVRAHQRVAASQAGRLMRDDVKDTAALEARFLADHQRNMRMRRWRGIALNILGVLLFLAIWEIIPRLGFANPVLFPPPSKVIEAALPMFGSGEIPWNILV